jgi:dTDP-glucose pyrophosphorylase
MKNCKEILLKPSATVKEAMQVIDKGGMRIALVMDENQKLLGTLTDGDIRRALLGSYDLQDSIEEIIFKHPTTCRISDTREQILDVAIKNKLYQVPIIDGEGKVVGLEEVESLLKPQHQTNRVVLMVGGLGTRLRPLTEHIPKPMLKVGDRPILETIILNFKKYGFTNIVLSVSYKADLIKSYFDDGSKLGVKIEYIHEDKKMGTAGALSLIKEWEDEPFFVMNGDILTNVNFKSMLNHHTKSNSVATMGVREYDFQVPYGVVNLEENTIESIEEKPVYNFFVSAGIYVLEPKALELIPKESYFDMPELFTLMIESSLKTNSFPIQEYWLDIGRIDEFKQANDEYKEIF